MNCTLQIDKMANFMLYVYFTTMNKKIEYARRHNQISKKQKQQMHEWLRC